MGNKIVWTVMWRGIRPDTIHLCGTCLYERVEDALLFQPGVLLQKKNGYYIGRRNGFEYEIVPRPVN